MSVHQNITFAVAVNNCDLFEANFLASPCLRKLPGHQILVQEHFDSAAKAYNDAIDKSTHDLIVFAHQDVILPESWPTQLNRALEYLDRDDPRWGVLGCYGVTVKDERHGYVYSSGLGVLGKPFSRPAPVQTLDELVLIVRKPSGLRFDETLPHFHLYGTDICMAAAKRGMKSYAISAFCIHNTQLNLVLPKDFYECCRHVERVWREYLPIQTSCIRLTKFNLPLYRRRFQELYLRHIRRMAIGAFRARDSRQILSLCDNASRNQGDPSL